jgi:DNA-binding XRE family transcriptional regulator
MPDRLTPTPAEALWLWRRSRGLNQAGAAARLGVGRGLVSAVERGLADPARLGRLRVVAATPSLELALMRRRSGLGLAGTAARLGVSPPTLLAMEDRADPALTKFWRGFTFAR